MPEAISVNEILSDKKLQAENRYVQVSEMHNIHKIHMVLRCVLYPIFYIYIYIKPDCGRSVQCYRSVFSLGNNNDEII